MFSTSFCWTTPGVYRRGSLNQCPSVTWTNILALHHDSGKALGNQPFPWIVILFICLTQVTPSTQAQMWESLCWFTPKVCFVHHAVSSFGLVTICHCHYNFSQSRTAVKWNLPKISVWLAKYKTKTVKIGNNKGKQVSEGAPRSYLCAFQEFPHDTSFPAHPCHVWVQTDWSILCFQLMLYSRHRREGQLFNSPKAYNMRNWEGNQEN